MKRKGANMKQIRAVMMISPSNPRNRPIVPDRTGPDVLLEQEKKSRGKRVKNRNLDFRLSYFLELRGKLFQLLTDHEAGAKGDVTDRIHGPIDGCVTNVHQVPQHWHHR